MAAFSIHASKDGQMVTTVRIGPTITMAKARTLLNEGWQVHVTDENGHQYGPEKHHPIRI